GLLAGDMEAGVGPVGERAESYEAPWDDTSAIEAEEEPATELPTFAYEDEDATPETELVEDEDPLGLAQHLATGSPAPPEPQVAEPDPATEQGSDWLDDIAEDEPAPWEQTPTQTIAPDEPDVAAVEVE